MYAIIHSVHHTFHRLSASSSLSTSFQSIEFASWKSWHVSRVPLPFVPLSGSFLHWMGFSESWPSGNITAQLVMSFGKRGNGSYGRGENIKRIHIILHFNRVLPLNAVCRMMACSTCFRIYKGRGGFAFSFCADIMASSSFWSSGGGLTTGGWAGTKGGQAAYSSNRQVVRMALHTAYGSQFELGRRSSR